MARKSTASQLTEYRRKRDFRRTAEPPGGPAGEPAASQRLRFVIQKHAASHLHFDLRLELNGVMKSWAVPKGPSSDPGVRRLAMQVEDHPIEYNDFEGTIPQGEYGGGTVMLWDAGTYSVDGAEDDAQQTMEERYTKGDVKVTFFGERVKGSYALVRMKPRTAAEKPSWLLIKHRDEHAGRGDIAVAYDTSVVSGRTMEEIAEDAAGAVWKSNRKPTAATRKRAQRSNGKPAAAARKRAQGTAARTAAKASRGTAALAALQPMLATIGKDIPEGDWTFEPKYDGIRVLAYCTKEAVRLITRNGLDKSRQFPEIVEGLRKLASAARRALVLDGEIVALADDAPARFQALQARMHVTRTATISQHRDTNPAAFIAFDILLDGDEPLLHEPWKKRRAILERRLGKRVTATVRLAPTFPREGEKLITRSRSEGWEGVIAKKMDARYEAGTRSRSWLKLKTEHQQEFVVGGWTEPRNSRRHIGAILLGYYDANGELMYAGHTGGGFSGATLSDMYRRLKPLERKSPPFSTKPKTNERAHWTQPKIVVEVRFNEWTADGKLRQPIFLGVRADKDAREVRREAGSVQPDEKNAAAPATKKRAAGARKTGRGAVRKRRPAAARTGGRRMPGRTARKTPKVGRTPPSVRAARSAARSGPADSPVRTQKGNGPHGGRGARERGSFPSPTAIEKLVRSPAHARVLRQLDELCSSERRGTIEFAGGRKLSVTNLDKRFFPEGYTKGDLLRYYTIVASLILPTVKDRPLVLRRFPNGIGGQAFYQQKAQADTPRDVRVETVVNDEGERQKRMVGGDLLTLLYTIQLGAVSVDPWHSRLPDLDFADYAVVDLDPGPRAPFRRVVDVALWVKEVLDDFGLHAALKTSGATGLHVYIPLPARTPNEAATVVAQMIATRVAEEHPKQATIVRWVKQRGESTVYVDYLQNIKGKTLAGPYCVRAREGATVSTPLSWDELDHDLDPRDFTIVSAPERFATIGDIWNPVMKRRNSLAGLLSR